MARESLAFAGFNLSLLPPMLLGLALLLGLLAFGTGWFAVTTRIQLYQYDESDDREDDGDPRGAGTMSPLSIRIHTEMLPLSMSTKIDPKDIQRELESRDDMPTYDREMDGTGSAMLGTLLFHIVGFASLLVLAGAYFWHQRSPRDLSKSFWRFLGLFAAFSVLSMAYMGLEVPRAAREDTAEVLHGYSFYLDQLGIPSIDPRMLEPNVKFWNRWICCPPESHFPRDGQELLVVVTTESRPSAGWFLVAGEMALAGVALLIAARTGQLGPKFPSGPRPEAVYAPPPAPKP